MAGCPQQVAMEPPEEGAMEMATEGEGMMVENFPFSVAALAINRSQLLWCRGSTCYRPCPVSG